MRPCSISEQLVLLLPTSFNKCETSQWWLLQNWSYRNWAHSRSLPYRGKMQILCLGRGREHGAPRTRRKTNNRISPNWKREKNPMGGKKTRDKVAVEVGQRLGMGIADEIYSSGLMRSFCRSNSAERRKSDDASPRKEGSRSRSNSDDSKRKGSAFMASMKAAMLVSSAKTQIFRLVGLF